MSSKTTSHFLMRSLLANQAQDLSRCNSNRTSQQQIAHCQLLLSDFFTGHLFELNQNHQQDKRANSDEDNRRQLFAKPDEAHRASKKRQLGGRWPPTSSPPEVIDLSLTKRCSHDEAHECESTNEPIDHKFDLRIPSEPLAEPGASGLSPSNGNNNETRTRRMRTMFSEWQLSELEWRFGRNKYLITSDRHRMAKFLKLDQIQVKTWFQNRRMKWKKQILASGIGVKSPTKPKGRPKRDSIPPIDDELD